VTALTQLADGLEKIVGRGHIITDAGAAAQYAVDNIVPKAVVFPKDTHQISEVVKYANKENLAIVPRGSGTKMSGGNPPKRLDLVVCTSRLNHMPDVDTANLTMTAEAGVKFRDIQARLATREDRCYLPLENLDTEAGEFICSERSNSGCFLPLDPPFSTKATIGGILAANSTGPRRLLYGLPRDMVLGVRFVTPGGEIVGTGGKTVKNVSGYDISKLMIGSTGSLGVLCEMTLRLLPLPERMETLLLSFGSFEEACAMVDGIFENPLLPAAVEIINKGAFACLKQAGESVAPEAYTVAVALETFGEAVDRMRLEILEIAKNAGIQGNVILTLEDHQFFWLSLGNLQTVAAGRYPGLVSIKLSYQVSEWKRIIQFADDLLSSSKLEHTIQCHAGNGVCFINLLVDGNAASVSERAVSAIAALLERTRKAGGNLIVRMAPPELKPKLPVWGATRQDLLVMTRIKKQLDPSGIMSPGRFVGNL